MFDKGLLPVDEFAKKLINQGMIQGVTENVLRSRIKSNTIQTGKITTFIYNDDEELGDLIYCSDYIDDEIRSNLASLEMRETDPIPFPIEYVSDYNNSERKPYLDVEGGKKVKCMAKVQKPCFYYKRCPL